MKRLKFAMLLFGLLMWTVPQSASAQVDLGPRLGIEVSDIEEVYLGADVRFRTESLPFVVNPTADFYFVDGGSYFTLIVNGLYPFGVDNEAFTPYAGGGLGIFRASTDDQERFGQTIEGESATDVGVNLVGGAEFETESLRPFVQLHVSLVFAEEGLPDSLFGITGGLLFTLQ